MLTYPASIPLSTATLTHLSDLLRSARRVNRTRWRRLDPGRQALLVLAHLRNGDTYARLAGGFGIGVATVYRYIREALDLLAATAPTLERVVYQAARLLWVILDGTLIPIDRVAVDRPYYSGKHKRHGVNVQVLADTRGRLLWASPALPGAVHDVKAARTHGIPAALIKFGVACLRRQRLPRRRTDHRGAVPARTPTTIGRATPGQRLPRPQPRTRRTRHGHPQNLEATDQACCRGQSRGAATRTDDHARPCGRAKPADASGARAVRRP